MCVCHSNSAFPKLWHTYPKALVSPSRNTDIHINSNNINLKKKKTTYSTFVFKPQIHLVLNIVQYQIHKSKKIINDNNNNNDGG